MYTTFAVPHSAVLRLSTAWRCDSCPCDHARTLFIQQNKYRTSAFVQCLIMRLARRHGERRSHKKLSATQCEQQAFTELSGHCVCLFQTSVSSFLADRTSGRAYATVLLLSVRNVLRLNDASQSKSYSSTASHRIVSYWQPIGSRILYEKSIATKMNDLDLCLEVVFYMLWTVATYSPLTISDTDDVTWPLC